MPNRQQVCDVAEFVKNHSFRTTRSSCCDADSSRVTLWAKSRMHKRKKVKLHRSDFLREAKAVFPELRDSFNRQLCGLHLEMHVLCDHVQVAIESGDRKIVGAAYRLVERWFMEGNRALVNAVAVSFLEDLNFKDDEKCRSWAERMMPPVLAEERRDIFEYLRNPIEYVRKRSEREP